MTLDERIAYEGTIIMARKHLGMATWYFQDGLGKHMALANALTELDEARECIVRLQAMGRPYEVEAE